MAQTTRHNPAAVHAPSSGYSMGLEVGQHLSGLAGVSGEPVAAAAAEVDQGAAGPRSMGAHRGQDMAVRVGGPVFQLVQLDVVALIGRGPEVGQFGCPHGRHR